MTTMPEELVVGRSDPVYMAHGYLTKVPVPAIVPFVEEYCPPDGIVVDPFAGSGMTGVAAAIAGRRAHLYDISVLGRHVGTNYLNLVDGKVLRKVAHELVERCNAAVSDCYRLLCQACGRSARLAKAVWSIDVACAGCGRSVNYYDALEAAAWSKPSMECPECGSGITARLDHVAERRVLDYVSCDCSPKQLEQAPRSDEASVDLSGALAWAPHVEITPDRQMYQAQSLGKSGRTTVASFYSPRNLAVLSALRREIAVVPDPDIRSKLLFAFTASLTRASKRYQWSRQRPLNAANANYYVAPVFYEWNVFDLFLRKVEAAARSDDFIRASIRQNSSQDSGMPVVSYEIASAEAIPLPESSVDYVFTDPPFGSNLFYADMALFQEAWLDSFTDVSREAVVRRGRGRSESMQRYEKMLTQALRECARIVKPGGRVSMVFGNSSGAVWSLLQRAVSGAGLVIQPSDLVVLNKGQRSVKGLASGFEHIATLDLIITMTEAPPGYGRPSQDSFPKELIIDAVHRALSGTSRITPSHLYLELLRTGLRQNLDLGELDLRTVTSTLLAEGWDIDSKSGALRRGG